MKKMKVLQFGAAALRQKAGPVTVFNKKLHQIIDAMHATLKASGNGAALAANQVGLLKRIVVIDVGEVYYELVNPEITSSEGSQYGPEGCLSLVGYEGNVSRSRRVTVRFQDRYGEWHEIEEEGFMARCLQHEIDHLEGVLYIDRMIEPTVINPGEGNTLALKDIVA